MREDIKKYRESEAINYSLLSKLSDHPRKLDVREETYSLTFGSLVDILIFTPEEYDERFYMMQGNKPSDTICKIIELIYTTAVELEKIEERPHLEDWEEGIAHAAHLENYGQKWKKETVIRKVIEEGKNYYEELKQKSNRTIITLDDKDRAMLAVTALKTNEYTKEYFKEGKDGDIEVIFQKASYWSEGKVKYKRLTDIVFINHKLGNVIPIDLKTTSAGIESFRRDYVKYKYYLESAMDVAAMKAEYKDCKICNPMIIAINSKKLDYPIIYRTTTNDIAVGTLTGTLKNTDKKIRGYRELTKEYLWHKENDKWDYPYNIYKNNGRTDLNVFE